MVCDRPALIQREQMAQRGWGSHRLHCADGPAIAWRDGYALYFWHGVRVPQDVIEQPELITAQRILGETNAEIRRVMLERMGIYEKKIRLILNRYVKSKLMTLESVEKALGARVYKNKEKEIGWYDVWPTEAGRRDPLLRHFGGKEKIFFIKQKP